MKKILLTEAQYELLKSVLDDACERGIHADRATTEALWHACARAETVPDRSPSEDPHAMVSLDSDLRRNGM